MVKNFKPDVIFIDYFDCLKHTTDMRLTQVQAATRCIKKIDEFAKTHKYAIWVMQQTNRQGAQAATKGDVEGNIQGAFAVQQTTGVNMYLTKSEEEKSANKASLTLKKNRQGCLCTFESFYFNNGTLQIDMSTATTSADVELAIAEFNSGRQKNWEQVHNDLQKQYVTSQRQQNTNVNNSGCTMSGNYSYSHDPRKDWPEDM
jgi:succinate dehydrogenase/fumarate reductase flavoprotein subunit